MFTLMVRVTLLHFLPASPPESGESPLPPLTKEIPPCYHVEAGDWWDYFSCISSQTCLVIKHSWYLPPSVNSAGIEVTQGDPAPLTIRNVPSLEERDRVTFWHVLRFEVEGTYLVLTEKREEGIQEAMSSS